MRCLLVVAALAACALGYRDEMLESNRIPEARAPELATTCTECQTVIHNVIAAIDDPVKLRELKMLLNALCHETAYEMECKMVVSRIDVIIKRLEPYLKDAEQVCKKLHLCSNAKLEAFHRIGLLYLKQAANVEDAQGAKNDFICDECQLAAIELKKAVDDINERAAIKAFISEKICKHIPKYSGACDLMLEEFLPELWQSLDALLANPKAACGTIGFCSKQAFTKHNKAAGTALLTYMRNSSEVDIATYNKDSMTCDECNDAYLLFLKYFAQPNREMTIAVFKSAGIILGAKETPFVQEQLARILEYVARRKFFEAVGGEEFCHHADYCVANTKLDLMKKVSTTSVKCETCRAVQALLKYEIDQPDFTHDFVKAVEGTICANLKGYDNFCENLSETYLPELVKKTIAVLASGEFCKDIVKAC